MICFSFFLPFHLRLGSRADALIREKSTRLDKKLRDSSSEPRRPSFPCRRISVKLVEWT
jgi:hypothetical protein